MALYGSNNTTGYLGIPFATTRQGIHPITIIQWIRNDYASNAAAFGFQGAGYFSQGNNWEFHFSAIQPQWFCDEEDSSGAEYFIGPANPLNVGVWNCIHICAKGDGTRYYYDNVTYATVPDANVAAATTPYSHFGIGYTPAVDAGFNFDSNIAIGEVAVWTCELSLANYQALAQGANPTTIRRDHLQHYYPLKDNLNDYGPMGFGLQPLGTNSTYSFTSHPPVAPIPRKRFLMKSATISTGQNVYANYPW